MATIDDRIRWCLEGYSKDNDFPQPIRGLATVDGIYNGFKPFRGIAMVYMLISKDRVIYVGCSEDIFSRILSHQKDKKFTEVYFARFDSKHLALCFEYYAIRYFRPKHNIAHTDLMKKSCYSYIKIEDKNKY